MRKRLTNMAKRTILHLIDDLDGKPAEETVQFGWAGTSYEIDLSSKTVSYTHLTLPTSDLV